MKGTRVNVFGETLPTIGVCRSCEGCGSQVNKEDVVLIVRLCKMCKESGYGDK